MSIIDVVRGDITTVRIDAGDVGHSHGRATLLRARESAD